MVLSISLPCFETKQVMLFLSHHSSSNLLRFLGHELPFTLFIHWQIYEYTHRNDVVCVIIV